MFESQASPQIILLLVVLLLVVALVAKLRSVSIRIGKVKTGLFGVSTLIFYVAFVLFVASTGAFFNFAKTPPPIMIPVAIGLVTSLVLAFSPFTKPFLHSISQPWILALQSFRFPLELVLWMLATERMLPVELSFHGRNFDILMGLSAPFMALYAYKRPHHRLPLVFWNAIGIILVLNVSITGMLSAPTKFQLLKTDPANFVMGVFPYSIIPAFLVPLALFLHFLSLRKLSARR